MPYAEVMHKWKLGDLHSGSKTGPKVKSQKQAVAIMLSEVWWIIVGDEEDEMKPRIIKFLASNLWAVEHSKGVIFCLDFENALEIAISFAYGMN